MKKLYKLDDHNQIVSCNLVPDSYVELNDRTETTVVPPNGLYEPLTFNFDTREWAGATHQEWLSSLTILSDDTASNQDEINAFLLKEVATLHTQLGGVDNG